VKQGTKEVEVSPIVTVMVEANTSRLCVWGESHQTSHYLLRKKTLAQDNLTLQVVKTAIHTPTIHASCPKVLLKVQATALQLD
jgi:hypothetical protein